MCPDFRKVLWDEQKRLEKNQGIPKPPRAPRYQDEKLLSIPEELSNAPSLKIEDSNNFRTLIKRGVSEEEALRIILDRLKRRNLFYFPCNILQVSLSFTHSFISPIRHNFNV